MPFFLQHNLCVILNLCFICYPIYIAEKKGLVRQKKGLVRQKKGLVRQKKGLVRQKERFSPSKRS